MAMRYDKFILKLKEASTFIENAVSSGDLEVKDKERFAIELAKVCGSKEETKINYGPDGDKIVEFCSVQRREKEIAALFPEKPRRAKYLTKRLAEPGGPLKKLGRGLFIARSK